MHSIWHHLLHAKHGPPLKPKNPFIAFVCGFLFGPFGVGIYLESWTDFWILLAILLIATFSTVGLAAPVAWVFCGLWGAVRASSRKH